MRFLTNTIAGAKSTRFCKSASSQSSSLNSRWMAALQESTSSPPPRCEGASELPRRRSAREDNYALLLYRHLNEMGASYEGPHRTHIGWDPTTDASQSFALPPIRGIKPIEMSPDYGYQLRCQRQAAQAALIETETGTFCVPPPTCPGGRRTPLSRRNTPVSQAQNAPSPHSVLLAATLTRCASER